MFKINNSVPEPLSIYLARPDCSILCCLDEFIDAKTASLKICVNAQYELSFTLMRSGNKWFDYVKEGMQLFVEHVGYFKIGQPSVAIDPDKESKEVSAKGCDSELEDKICTFPINMGTKQSMEYLVEYEDGEEETLVNPYTGIPYDWIVLYNTFPEQLKQVQYKYNAKYYGSQNSNGETVVSDSAKVKELERLFKLIPRLKCKVKVDSDGNTTATDYIAVSIDSETEEITGYVLSKDFGTRISDLISYYERYRDQLSLLSIILKQTNGNWAIGNIYGVSDGDYSLANTKGQFDIDENVYSFLTNTMAQAMKCVVSFDIINRKVNVTPVDKVGEDTGIMLSYDTLLNKLDITDSEDNLATRIRVTGGDDLNISQVNFGSNYIDDLSYKINAVDEDGNRIYVSDDFAKKYNDYISKRENLRAKYVQLSKDYRNYLEQIDELINRVPNDYLKTDWGTFNDKELVNYKKQFEAMLTTLLAMYKEEAGKAGFNTDGTVYESYMQHTIYWYDYKAYKYIIEQLDTAIKVYPYYNDTSKWKVGYTELYEKRIKAWETEWTLYGIDELKAKIQTYKQNMDVLAASNILRKRDSAQYAEQYKASYEPIPWSELDSVSKRHYSQSVYNDSYNAYLEYYNNMLNAQTYLDKMEAEESELESKRDAALAERTKVVDDASIEGNFAEEEIKTINRLYKDADYSNENFITTSIQTSDEKIDTMYELLEDAKEQVSIYSRPQLAFSVEAENLIALPEFEPMWDQFKEGNFIYVQYRDNRYIRLRIKDYTFNPSDPSDNSLKITFSTFIRSRSYYHDWASLLGTQGGSGVSSSSGGSGGSGNGTFGTADGVDITISNTMLAKLLSTDKLVNRVNDIVMNSIDGSVLQSYKNVAAGLANGDMYVDGNNLKTGYITSNNYNGKTSSVFKQSPDGNIYTITERALDNTEGSILDLDNGAFSFAGGELKYQDDTLSVKGTVQADKGYIGGENGFKIDSAKIVNGDMSNAVDTAHEGVYIGTDGINVSGGSPESTSYFTKDGVNIGNKLIWNGTKLSISGDLVANTLSSGGKDSPTSKKNGLYIDSQGNIYSGANNQTVINSDGTFNFGNGSIQWDGTVLTVNGKVTGSLYSGGKTSSSDKKNGLIVDEDGNLIAGENDSVIIRKDGTFDFGSGKLTLDGKGNLTATGAVIATSLTIGSKKSSAIGSTGLYVDGDGNLYAGTNNDVKILSDGKFYIGGDKVAWDGKNLALNGGLTGSVTGNLYAGRKSPKAGNSGLMVDSTGNLTAGTNNDVIINSDGTFNFGSGKLTLVYDSSTNQSILTVRGKIQATSGYIGSSTGFNIGNTSIYNGRVDTDGNVAGVTDTSVSGVYLGTDGIVVSGGTPSTTSYITKSKFNVGNKIVWDGNKLSIAGSISSDDGTIGGFEIGGSYLRKGSMSSYLDSAHSGVYIGNSGIGISSGTGYLSYFNQTSMKIGDNDSYISFNDGNLEVTGSFVAKSLSTGSKTSASLVPDGYNGGIFIDSSGNLYAGDKNQVIIESTGDFYISDGSNKKISWDGSTLEINGTLTGTVLGSLSATKKSNDDYVDGMYISSTGHLTAGKNGAVEINGDGTFKFGIGQNKESLLTFNGSTLKVIGDITATRGFIGGDSLHSAWEISTGRIFTAYQHVSDTSDVSIADGTDVNNLTGIKYVGINSFDYGKAFYAGATNKDGSDGTFRVDHDGSLYASDAIVYGDIRAKTGYIGGENDTEAWKISTGKINTQYADSSNTIRYVGISTSDWAFYAGGAQTNGSDGVFRVNKSGTLYATGAQINGTITAGNKKSIADNNTGVYIDGSSGAIVLGAHNSGEITLGGDGSIISTGGVSLASGGIVYDPSNKVLTVKGAIVATSLSTGSKTSANANANGIFIDSSGNLYAGSSNQTQIKANGTFSFGGTNGISYSGSKVTLGSNCEIAWDSVTGTGTVITEDTLKTVNLTATNLKVTSANIEGEITANQINTTGLIAENIRATTISGKTISGCTISGGKITAIGGSIGGFNIINPTNGSKPYLQFGTYNENGSITILPQGGYGGDGSTGDWVLTIGKSFKVTSNGKLYASGATVDGTITTSVVKIKYNNVVKDAIIPCLAQSLTTGIQDGEVFDKTEQGLSIASNYSAVKIASKGGSLYTGTLWATGQVVANSNVVAKQLVAANLAYGSRIELNAGQNGNAGIELSGNYNHIDFKGADSIDDYVVRMSQNNNYTVSFTGKNGKGVTIAAAVFSGTATKASSLYGKAESADDTVARPVVTYPDSSRYVGSLSSKNTNEFRVHAKWGESKFDWATIIVTRSDIRLKKNIRDTEIRDALSIINRLKLRSFDWKSTNAHQKIGFIADEMEDVDPNFSIGGETEEDGSICYKSVDTFYLLGYLTKAVQELSSEVKELKSKLNKEIKE